MQNNTPYLKTIHWDTPPFITLFLRIKMFMLILCENISNFILLSAYVFVNIILKLTFI